MCPIFTDIVHCCWWKYMHFGNFTLTFILQTLYKKTYRNTKNRYFTFQTHTVHYYKYQKYLIHNNFWQERKSVTKLNYGNLKIHRCMADILPIRRKHYPINQSINQNSNYEFLRYVFYQLYPFSSQRKMSRNIAVLYPELKKKSNPNT